MTHGVSGIDWKHNKHSLPKHVYDVYMRYGRMDFHSVSLPRLDQSA